MVTTCTGQLDPLVYQQWHESGKGRILVDRVIVYSREGLVENQAVHPALDKRMVG